MEALKNSNNKNFFKSFHFAISGLKLAFKERNFKNFLFYCGSGDSLDVFV
jgi:diacylglycerol kinase